MEIKVTFRFDASETLLACIDQFRQAAEMMAASNVLHDLPEKGAGIVRAIVSKDGITVNKKEQIFPPVDTNPDAEDTPENGEPRKDFEEPRKDFGEPQEESTPEAPAEEEAPVAVEATAETYEPASEEDVRAAMHRTRCRIEGEDYKENTTGVGYQTFHRALTSEFKFLSAQLGADKPSQLAPERRRDFIEVCDRLEVNSEGQIVSRLDF